MAARHPRKNALRAALDAFANPENRQDILKVLHATLSTAMVESALEKGDDKSAAKRGYKAECFAECIRMIEEEMEGPASPFIPKKQTVLTTPAGMPASGVVRAADSRQATPPQQ